MQDTEEFVNWLESRRLIIAKLSTLDAAIGALDAKIDRCNEVARERTAEMFNDTQKGIVALKSRAAVRELQGIMWSVAIGFMTGGLASVIVNLLMRP